MKIIYPFVAVLGLAGCENIEIQYTSPANQGDFAAVESQANDHYELFVLPKTYILVAPVQPETDKKADAAGETSSNKKPGTTVDKSTAKVSGNAAKDKKTVATTTTAPDNNQASSPTLHNGLATAIIDGMRWEAKVVQLPDDGRVMAVKGVSGFWKSTTIGITKYQNTDLVSSVSSTAENLAPKRIGQVAAVVATAIQIGALVGGVNAQQSKATVLEPFVIEVPAGPNSSGSINEEWTYTFKYDNPTPPPGTVLFQDFLDKAMNRKVSYWPVPVCRSATLQIGTEFSDVHPTFHVTVSSPEVVRLQPLPVKGKIELGSICGATMSGTATADNFATFSDDLQSIQQAIKTIKDAKDSVASEEGSEKAQATQPAKK